jgi:hypothetical protein
LLNVEILLVFAEMGANQEGIQVPMEILERFVLDPQFLAKCLQHPHPQE